METMIGPVVNILLTAAAGLLSIPWLRDAVEVSRTRVTEMSPNDNEEAEQVFLDLLGEAETEIVMYDDGDANQGSLYQSSKVVQAVKDKIHENPTFKVDCVLNNRTGATLFETELASRKKNVRSVGEVRTRAGFTTRSSTAGRLTCPATSPEIWRETAG